MTREKTTAMRILIDKEVYKKLRMYCLQQNTPVSGLVRTQIHALLKEESKSPTYH